MKRRLAFSGLLTVILTRLLIQSAAAQSYLPELRIAKSNDIVTVSWPVSAYYYVLEATTNSPASATWMNLSTASEVASNYPTVHPGVMQITTNIVGDEIRADLPVSNDQQFFRLESPPLIPVFRFAIFYNGLLEFSTTSSMFIKGPVHANGPVYVGAGFTSTLTFDTTVTSTSTLGAPDNNGDSWPSSWRTTFNGSPGYITNVPAFTLPGIGTNNSHFIIEMPTTNDATTALGQQRLYNQAQMILLVSNTIVTLRIQAPISGLIPGMDPTPTIVTSTNTPWNIPVNFPFLNLTNVFTDQRESKTILATQIDVGKFSRWIKTNSNVQAKLPSAADLYPTILYVADNRTNSSSQLSAIRLTNGIAPPVNGNLGFTVVTPNPLYVWGHYNCTNLSGLGTTNTTTALPCAFMADAITILSPNWQDSQSSVIFASGVRPAASTTVNAAILTGAVPSTGSSRTTFSGGVQNLTRLLEDWTGDTLTLNTSIVNLYNSTKATHQWMYQGNYYLAPLRQFSLDQNLWNPAKLPPGTPCVRVAPGN